MSKNFSASTDFKVGQAVVQLRKYDCEVLIRYKATNDRRAEEKSWIESIKKRSFQLLNRLSGYNYATAKRPDKQRRVEEFIDKILLKKNKE